MGDIKQPQKEKLVIAFIYKNEEVYNMAKADLEAEFGEIDYESPVIKFEFTLYYKEEMGPGLLRRFVSFKNTVDPDRLAGIKVFTNQVEEKYFKEGTKHRSINIDPGLLALGKFVLATTKDFAHRIYIGKGIFAEVTLRYKDKRFTKLEWTYPDYATEEYGSILGKIREIYKGQI